jgi:ADP-heptose:LPS heptosyltransferase
MLSRAVAAPPSLALPTVQTVLVFRALRLGDMLCAVPALRALREALPGASIALAGLPWASLFTVRFNHYIDEFIPFPGHPDLPEQPGDPFRFRKFRREMRARRFGLAIQMQGSGTVSNEIVMSLGARMTAGFHPAEGTAPDPDWFASYPRDLPEVERNLELLRHLGIPSRGSGLEFPVLDEDEQELSRSGLSAMAKPGTYVCIHPGASRRDKCWPVDRFASVARALRKRGVAVVVTGDRSEADLAAQICAGLGGDCIDGASPNLGLGALALLIGASRLLLCNDTGVSHLAAALKVPSVVIFSQADPLRWAPGDRKLHRALGKAGGTVAADEVLRAVVELLVETRLPR